MYLQLSMELKKCLCIRNHSKHDRMVTGGQSSVSVAAEKIETRKRLCSCTKKLGSWLKGAIVENSKK